MTAAPTPVRVRELRRLRLAAQRLVGPRCDSPAEAVRWMGCMQAQDLPGALTSIALRSAGSDGRPAGLDDVHRALADGSVLRTWPMRGTLHLVPGEDLGWMVDLASARASAAHTTRRRQLGIDDTTVDRARDELLVMFDDADHLSRATIVDRWSDAGIDVSGGRGYHLLYVFAAESLICQADDALGVHGFVHHRRWLAARGVTPRDPGRESALAEWVLRFVRSHGPVTERDFQRWTTLPLREVRPALASVADRLETVSCDGVTHWMDPGTPERLAEAGRSAGGTLLLPGFDEYLLGYGDRSHALAAEHAQRVVPGGNGMFRRTVVHGGTVIGTWSVAGSGARWECRVEAFSELTATQERGIARAFRALPR